MTRKTDPIDEELMEEVHRTLGRFRVTLIQDPSGDDLRVVFSRVRNHRNRVSTILARLLPRRGRMKAELTRLDRTIERESAVILDQDKGMFKATTVSKRTARVKVQLGAEHDLRAEIRADLDLLEEAIGHCRLVREELRFVFEEASRSLASLQWEWKVETSAP